LRIDVLTLFPQMVANAVDHSILKRASESGLVTINAVNLRLYALDKHHTTDDTPCGGGGGMIMKPEPVLAALDALRTEGCRIILTDPQGEVFDQAKARALAEEKHVIILCGRYEGVDERIRSMVTDEMTIGDYVLTGGELPALVMIDAITRLLPGALGDEAATGKDSFSEGLLEYPQYTRPRTFEGQDVPEILFSGHRARIARWRRWHQLIRTRDRRPDIWAGFTPTKEDNKILLEGEPE